MPRVGIVGMPNVGKSTLFNALTRSHRAQAANFPFCTIEPNMGIVNVPDDRLQSISSLMQSEKTISAVIEFVDIAGLVEGASEGAGLGNQFLSHIRKVDAIVQVVRCFNNTEIHHIAGTVNPLRDIDIISTELILADLACVQKRHDRLVVRTSKQEAELHFLEKLIQHLDKGHPASTLEYTREEKELLRSLFLLSSKPTLFACNVCEEDLVGSKSLSMNSLLQSVKTHIFNHLHTTSVTISAKIESELSELLPSEAEEFLSELGLANSSNNGIAQLIRSVYHLLELRTYFTAGRKETHAWTIHEGDKAPTAAGIIHSDLERGFIAAETVSYEDFVQLGGSWAKAKETGRLRIEGKEYIVRDGDIIEFRFNV